MNAGRRAVGAALLSLALVLELPVSGSAMAAPPALPAPTRLVAPPLAHAPTRAELHAVAPTHEGGGVRGDFGSNAVAHDGLHAPPDPRAMSVQRRRPAARTVGPSVGKPARHASSVVGGSGCSADPSSSPVLSTADRGTGINHWWRFEEGAVPGVGRYFVNVATQNLIVQSDDLDIHNAGIDLAFRRTYNSLSQHDAVGSDGATPSELGNGWTSTLDAHLSGNASGGMTVSDIDGARYDYTADGQGNWLPPAGQHATLITYDGGRTYQWTKKTGTAYIFATPYITGYGTTYQGYSGRLLKVYGRNHNTYIALTYSWSCNVAASNANLSEVDVSTQAGVTAKLYFASFSGHQLLSKLVWPDGVTSVTYSYDADGNLVAVQKPLPPNSPATAPEQYIYASGNFVAESPRFSASGGNEGGYLAVFWTSTRQATGIQGAGLMNFTPSDGLNAVLQPGVNSGIIQYDFTTIRNVSPGLNEFHDSNGHDTYYYFDTANRVTEVTQWTGSRWLAYFQSWDSDDNLTADTDARGYETDYAYDGNGNTVAVAQPQVTAQTSTGPQAIRPTQLYSYDQYNNVKAYCDQTWSQTHGKDWDVTGNPGPSDSLCPTTVGTPAQPGAAVMSYVNPTWEPFGELTAIVTPMGYQRTLSYVQSATDNGLPIAVTGTPITQADGTTVLQTNESFGYDASGNLTTYGTGNGTWNLTYDAFNRLTVATDPDGHSSYTYYLSNGEVSKTETAAQHAANAAGTYAFDAGVLHAYDVDGDEITQTHHHGNVQGTTSNWYDGADRLIEVSLPGDANARPVYTRYLYDLSGGSTVSVGGMSVRAYGNLYRTQEYTPTTISVINTPSQTTAATFADVRGQAFDALDRLVGKISFPPNANTTPVQATSTYDTSSATLGLLASTTDAIAETATMAYDALGRETGVTFGGDNGTTPSRTYVYDPNGRPAIVTSSVYGAQSSAYDADGHLKSVTEPSGGLTSPATIGYDYYPDGHRKDLTVQSSALSAPASMPLMTYVYRADGKRTALTFNYGGVGYPYTWTYSSAGRLSSQSDPFTGTAIPHDPSIASSATYATKQWTYDGNGDVQALSLPVVGHYTQMTHDLEGAVSAYTAIPANPASPGATFQMTIGSNIVGETSAVTYLNPPNAAPNTHAAVSQFAYQNGHTIPYMKLGGYPNNGKAVYDLVNGVRTELDAYTIDSETSHQCGYPNVTKETYDNAGRHTGTNTFLYDETCAGGPYTDTTTYDAENHPVQAVQNNAVPGDIEIGTWTMPWGPNGHPIALTNSPTGGTPSTAYLHYDGDTLLFTTSATGQLIDVRPELLGIYSTGSNLPYSVPATGGFVVQDRDFSELNVSTHGALSYTGLDYASGPLKNGKVTTTSVAADAGYPAGPDFSEGPGPDPILQYTHADGFSTPLGVIQGVRAMDPNLGTWKSPDAYAGDVRDPMSQKPYMWNGNNPYEYSDPSGYEPHIPALLALPSFTSTYACFAHISQCRNIAELALNTGLLLAELIMHIEPAPASSGGAASGASGARLGKALASEAQMAGALNGVGKAIAGAGTNSILRDSGRLSAQYGGAGADWAKMTSASYSSKDGLIIETHWYENLVTGKRVEFKTKIIPAAR